MAVCCCSLAGTAACQHCASNPFATDVWTNKTVTVDHIDAKPFGDGLDVCPVCGKPTTIGKPQTNADKLRAMTDEELAHFLAAAAPLLINSFAAVKCAMATQDKATRTWLDWLKQEI